MHKFIFYFSYLAFPFLIYLIYFIIKNDLHLNLSKTSTLISASFLLLTLLFIYSRFIERNLIVVNKTSVKVGFPAKLVVISDMHLGVYKSENFMRRVVDKINKLENVDAVLIPGDLTYYPTGKVEPLFGSLKKIKYPTFAVLGNHDNEMPGPPIQKELQESLEKNNITFLNNTSFKIPGKEINILGLADKWSGKDDISLIDDFAENDKLIVIAHNPDTTLSYKNSIADLTVSGHTHGGQIRIPFIYKKMIPCVGDFDQGLYKQKTGQVFVTSGLGEVALPMRLGIPPVIDVLNLF